ncbi:Late embryogenesis abundant protein [Carex littledalei]|uniref:Late embryogenesis abundant protein n=1 Tax=Carex littledalei TaxID=544730 RepID=A0A833QUR9_9POAL|nr:Late embryogenesis abundant protein [Carex littledalei]
MAVAPESPLTKIPQRNKLHHRRHQILLCFGTCGILLAIFIVLLTIGLTVYKVKEPIMTMNSITLENLAANSNSAASSSLNMSVIADVSVKNPNAVSYRYGSSMTSVYYHEILVGQAEALPGVALARRTVRMNVTVDLMISELTRDSQFVQDLVTGDVRLNTSTQVGGKVKVFGMVQHHVDVVMNCSLTVHVSNLSLRNQSCSQHVWL